MIADSLNGIRTFFASPYPYGIFKRQDKYLPVPDATGFGGILDRLDALGHLHHRVALVAGERLVLAVQLVAAVLLVVEADLLLPPGRLVAPGAVGPLAGQRELADVDVGVAAGAGHRERLVADQAGVARALKGMGYTGTVCMEAFASGDPEAALDAFRSAFTV